MRFEPRLLGAEERDILFSVLYSAVRQVSDPQEVRQLIDSLLNEKERAMLARRLIIARQLLAGRSYREIATSLGCGLSTVARVAHWLDHLTGDEPAPKRKRKTETYGKPMHLRYPGEFLLLRILRHD